MQGETMLAEDIEKLIICINSLQKHLSDVESITSTIIVKDDFDLLPDNVQGEILFLDNYDTEQPSSAQINASVEILKAYLGSIANE